jgi:hypothetical protein
VNPLDMTASLAPWWLVLLLPSLAFILCVCG